MAEQKAYRILIVDDVPQNIQVLGTILQSEGFDTGFATSGREALDLLDEHSYDLVLLDVMMPVMNGFEVCRIIRENKALAELPVIFITASNEIESVVEGFEAGAQDYVTKPFNPEELLARVFTHLELKDKREKLDDLNRHLEEKVKERTEELNIANEKLEKANKDLKALDISKNEFLSLISHEIRTPLNGIIGFTEILEEELESTGYMTFLNSLKKSTGRLERFAEKALLITDLRAGTMAIIRNAIQIESLTAQVYKQLNGLITEKNITVATVIAEGLEIEGDEHLLTVCLRGIVDNAVTYSPPGSEITVRASKLDRRIRIDVLDKGKGFSDEALTTLGKLFALGSAHQDNKLGLDMALASLVMKAHGGSVEVKNLETGAMVSMLFEKK